MTSADRAVLRRRGGQARRALAVLAFALAAAPRAHAQDVAPEAAAPDSAAEPTPAWGFEIEPVSRYVWRGIRLSDGAAVQPSLWRQAGPAKLGVWANVDASTPGDRGVNEIDGTLGMERKLGSITASPSAVVYAYPRGDAPTSGEVALELSRPLALGVDVGAAASADVVAYAGATFATLSLTHDATPWPHATLETQVSFSHGSGRFVRAYIADLAHGMDLESASASLEVEAFGMTLRPHVGADRVRQADVRDRMPSRPRFVAGVAMGRDF